MCTTKEGIENRLTSTKQINSYSLIINKNLNIVFDINKFYILISDI